MRRGITQSNSPRKCSHTHSNNLGFVLEEVNHCCQHVGHIAFPENTDIFYLFLRNMNTPVLKIGPHDGYVAITTGKYDHLLVENFGLFHRN